MGAQSHQPCSPLVNDATDEDHAELENELTYDVIDEHVCYSLHMLDALQDASLKMTAAAACATTQPALQRAALFAASLMSKEGVIRQHGLACVHKYCVRKYDSMRRNVQRLVTLSSLDALCEAVHTVLLLASEAELDENDADAVDAHVQDIADLVETPLPLTTGHLGHLPHTCVSLFDVGCVQRE